MEATNVRISFGDIWRSSASLCMMVSGLLRLFYFWVTRDAGYSIWLILLQGVLPIAACLAFSLMVIIPGHRGLRYTLMPVIMGCSFFMIKALDFSSELWTIFCHGLYCAVAMIFIFTVYEEITNPKYTVIATGIPLIAHIGMDIWELVTGGAGRGADWLPEISVLLIMVALFLTSVSMFRNKDE